MDEKIDMNQEAENVVAPDYSPGESKEKDKQKKWVIIAVIAFILIFALVILGIYFLTLNPAQTENIRDIFIIIMALESIFVGFVLALLVIQLARLINLLQNEIKPILHSTNDTANTLKGTAIFLSDHLTEPIIQLNGYLAALQKMTELFRFSKK